jgi:4,5-dihydroxyphthalate decarboxylase
VTKQINFACWDYDRTLPLAYGGVRPEGIDLNYIVLPVEETFFRMAKYQEFDVAEMSLSSYVVSLGGAAPFVALPVFPSRSFRHNGIYVNVDAGISEPGELAGRVVGIAEWQLTANVWIRGILADDYGVPVDAVTYRTGGLHRPGRTEKLPLDVAGIRVQPIEASQTLSEMLVSGDIDAIYTPRSPAPFLDGDPRVRRLWADPMAEERAYFARTGIFPIMHVVVLRRDVYQENRWIARSLYKAFEAAKAQAEERLAETAAPPNMLPWGYAMAESTRADMGRDFWPYGLSENTKVLQTFLRYSHEQGLADREYEPAELFCPETAEAVIV